MEFINLDRVIIEGWLWAMTGIMLVGPWMYGFDGRNDEPDQ